MADAALVPGTPRAVIVTTSGEVSLLDPGPPPGKERLEEGSSLVEQRHRLVATRGGWFAFHGYGVSGASWGAPVESLPAPEALPTAIGVFGERLVISASDGSLRVRPLRAGPDPFAAVPTHKKGATALGASEHLLVSGGADGTLAVRDRSLAPERTIALGGGLVLAVAVVRGEKLVVAACSDGTLRLVDVARGSEVARVELARQDVALALTASRTRDVVLAGTLRGSVLWLRVRGAP
jgi:hypothetical protein